MEHAYPTPGAFDRAVKKAVRLSGAEPGAGYRQALRDRFLCRVFSGGNDTFVLKGGSGLLARIPDARATRDVDFATSERVSAADALAEMERVAAIDLGDWCRFVLTKHEESMDENGYSRLLKLRFATFVGEEEKDPCSSTSRSIAPPRCPRSGSRPPTGSRSPASTNATTSCALWRTSWPTSSAASWSCSPAATRRRA